MTHPPDDTDWTALFTDFALGTLSEAETQQLQEQLIRQPELAQELAAFQAAFDLLPYALPVAAPTPKLKDNILRVAGLSASTPTLNPPAAVTPRHAPLKPVSDISAAPSFRQPRSRHWLTWASASIAAVAVAALGATQIQLRQQIAQTTALQQQIDDNNAELSSLRQQLQDTQAVTARLGESSTQIHSLSGAQTASSSPIPNARLIAKSGEREIVFIAESLPQLSTSQVYRLWAIPSDSPFADTIYCGQFRQDNSGTARWEAPDSACTASPTKLLITLDAPDDPITSAGPLVLESDA